MKKVLVVVFLVFAVGLFGIYDYPVAQAAKGGVVGAFGSRQAGKGKPCGVVGGGRGAGRGAVGGR